MGVELRTALFVTLALALAGCGESFATTETGSTGGIGGAGGGGSSSSSGGTGGAGGTGGGVTTSSVGGTGGAPCDDSDKDGDGFSECDGDCDDTLAFVFPDAIEICGDDIDEDCDGKSEDGPPCNGIGTFVSQQMGNVGATGTIDDPVATIAEGVEHAETIRALSGGAPTMVLVAAGSYVEDLIVTGSVSLIGGYDPTNWALRNPATFTTTIKNTKGDGLKLIGTELPMLLDGFSIQGRTVVSGSGPSIAVTIDGGEPILAGNVITGGPVNAGPGASFGVRVITETANGGEAAFYANEITSGDSLGGPAYGVAVQTEQMFVTLEGNQVVAAQGTDSVAFFVASAKGVDAIGNIFQSSTATGVNNVDSTSLGVWVKAGKLLFDANLVNPDQVFDPPKCFTPGAWCGGVRVSAPEAKLTNNIVYGSGSSSSAALHLVETGEGLAGVVVSSNLLLGAGDDGAGTTSTAVLLGSPLPDPGISLVGRFRNNIFLGGLSENNYAFFEEQVTGESVEPAALDHNLFYFPVSAPNAGILYLDWNGLAPQPITMVDGLPGDGANLFENPLLSGSHLDPLSPCRNKGTSADGPSTDMDGEDRPQEGEFDIGPDEVVPSN